VFRVGTDSWARPVVRALAPILVGVALSAWVVQDAGAHAREKTDANLRAGVAQAVTQVSAEIRDQLTKAPVSGFATGTTVTVAAARTSHASPDALIEARDSGSPVLDDATVPPSIVVPVYGSAAAPGTTEARRQGITAYQLVPLSLSAVLKRAAPEHGNLVVRSPGRAVAGTAPSGGRTFSADLDLGTTTGWTIQGWTPSKGVSSGTWPLVVLLLGLSAAASGVLLNHDRRSAAIRKRQDQLERDNQLVSGLAPVVQASLDLGEVIPAASSHLANGLSLQGLSLSAPGPGGERQLFAWGDDPDPTVVPVVTPPPSLGTGETFALSLARGGRALGVLRVVAGQPLTVTDLRALATASELLGSTLANAEAFAQQQSLLERMQSVDELKTVFLATASHELRTPVAAIVGFSTLVMQQWGQGDPEQTKSFLERVLSNARALETLTEQLLDFSRLERGIKPQAGELLDLARTTTKVLAEQPQLADGHRLQVDVGTDCLVHGSGPAVERIITNLVGNAAKYSPEGTTISVSVQLDGSRVVLLVDDEGAGVPEADRERVFTRFYRGRGDAVSSTRGAGVGLAIVAEFAASMSGTASVHEAPSGGARFRVTFPAVGPLERAENEGAAHVRLP